MKELMMPLCSLEVAKVIIVAIASLMASMVMSTVLLLEAIMELEDMVEFLLASIVMFSELSQSTKELEDNEESLSWQLKVLLIGSLVLSEGATAFSVI